MDNQQNPTGSTAPQQQPPQPQQPAQHNTAMAVVAYILFFVPLLTDAKNDPFVKFHVKQGLTLFISWLLAGIVGMIPVLGWILIWPLEIFLFILLIIGIINAVNGKQERLPVIGVYGDKFNF